MCHPGEIDDGLRALDPVVASRPLELAYLGSERFAAFGAGKNSACHFTELSDSPHYHVRFIFDLKKPIAAPISIFVIFTI